MQDHPSICVIGRRAGIVNRATGDREIGRNRRAEKVSHRRLRAGRDIRAVVSDPSAPRLVAIVHEDERVEDDTVALRFQIGDALDDRCVGRRAAVSESPVGVLRDRDNAERGLGEPGNQPIVRDPGRAVPLLESAVDIGGRGINLASCDVGAVAEPGADHGNRRAAGEIRLELAYRIGEVRARRRATICRGRGKTELSPW